MTEGLILEEARYKVYSVLIHGAQRGREEPCLCVLGVQRVRVRGQDGQANNVAVVVVLHNPAALSCTDRQEDLHAR